MARCRDIAHEIQAEWASFKRAIEDASGEWHDEVMHDFHRRFLDPWDEDVRRLVRGIDEIDAFLSDVRKRCRSLD